MIKRILFFLAILVLIFFVYHLLDKQWANELLANIRAIQFPFEKNNNTWENVDLTTDKIDEYKISKNNKKNTWSVLNNNKNKNDQRNSIESNDNWQKWIDYDQDNEVQNKSYNNENIWWASDEDVLDWFTNNVN